MRKPVLSVLLVLALVFGLSGQATQQTQASKPEDILKNLVTVEKTAPPAERMRIGFESISSRDSKALLTFISSDLLEGRETATPGYQLAAEYAASLFALWKLKPAGDTHLPDFRAMLFGGGRSATAGREGFYPGVHPQGNPGIIDADRPGSKVGRPDQIPDIPVRDRLPEPGFGGHRAQLARGLRRIRHH